MSLRNEIDILLKACNTGIWVVTQEPTEVERELMVLLNDPKESYNALYAWDAQRGTMPLHIGRDIVVPATSSSSNRSPQGAIEMLAALGAVVSLDAGGCRVLLLHNFHKFLHVPDVMQGLANALQEGKQTRTFAVMLSPSSQIPIELRTYFTVLHHELPDRREIEQIVRGLFPDDFNSQDVPAPLIDAAAGLTRYEAENAFSVSVAKGQRLEARHIFEYKAQALIKDGVLAIHKNEIGFESLGGLHGVKDFCLKWLTPRAGRKSVAKGIVALGVPGSGKSAFAKALGRETQRPTVVLDIASLLSKYVGESEGRLKTALHTLESLGQCICFIDEIEKGLSGVGSGLDSGVMDRLLGTLLTWRQDTKAEVFLIATSNDVSKMPAPLLRAGRTNAIFFFDQPNREEKDAIWPLYLSEYGFALDSVLPGDEEWTGAEIRNCCELAEGMAISLQEAAQMVVPIATTSKDQIAELRRWADGRVLSASAPGLYRRSAVDLNAVHKPKAAKRRNIKPGNENLN